jgi:hypothetical protein
MKRILSLFTVLLGVFALNAQSSCFALQMENTNGAVGDTICLDVTVNDFDEVLSMQYSFAWDPSLLELIEITNFNLPGLSILNFNTLPASWSMGQSALSWYDAALAGVSLPDETTLYSMCFKVLGHDTNGLAPVEFTATSTPVEIINATLLNASPYGLIHGGIQAGNDVFQIDSICITADNCNDKMVDVSFSGGQGPYTYNWGNTSGSITDNTLSIVNTIPGTYTLQLSDVNGKSVSALCDLTSPDDFLLTHIEVDEPTCNVSSDASISLSLSGGTGSYAANWSNGMSGLDLQGLALGTYAVTITDQGTGCTIFESVDIQSTKDISATTNYTCMDSLLSLNVAVWEGGTPPYQFEWSTGLIDSSSLFSSLQNVPDNTAYEVTITSQEGCAKVITFDTIDCESTQTDFLIAHSEQCEVYIDQPNLTDLSVVVWSGGTPPYTFQWSTGDVTVSTDPDIPASTLMDLYDGTYYVTVTDAQGLMDVYGPMEVDCDEDGTQLFTAYTVDCLSDSTANISLSAYGGTAPYTFEWENGTSQTHPATSLVTVTGNGVYSLTITDAAGNSLIEDNVEVDCETSSPSFLIADSYECTIFADTTLADVSVVVWAGGTLPYTFEWSTGETQLITDPNIPIGTITGDGNGTYYVTITDANGYSEPYGPITPNCGSSAAVELMAGSAEVQAGESFCVDITVANFNDIVGLQFSMAWNPDVLIFDTLLITSDLPAFNGTSFNLNDVSAGSLMTQWFNPSLQQLSLPDSTVLFSLCFQAGASAGSSDIAFTSVPVLVEFTDGNIILPVELTNGLVNVLGPEVWPGDTDNDENVDHYDLLNIGLAYGAAGPPRENPSIVWQGYYADDWGLSTPQSQLDYKHIDTNGDGFIDAADTLALVFNWGEESNFNAPEDSEIRLANGIIYVQPDTVLLGEEVVMNIIMEQGGTPVENVYGIAFTIVYDTSAVEPGSVFASFGDSWIGDVNQDLLPFYVDRYEDGRIDIAMTRIDGINTAGEGAIGQLHITIQDVIFMREEAYELVFDIENIRLIDVQEQESSPTPQQTTTFIKDGISSTQGQGKTPALHIYPNPANEVIYLQTQASIEKMEIRNLQGQLLAQLGNASRMATSHLQVGTYLLKVWTKQGCYVKRFSVMR